MPRISIDCSKPDSIPALGGYADAVKKRTVRGAIAGTALSGGNPDAMLRVNTLEGPLDRRAGDCVILMGVKGEVYPVGRDKFAKTYERALPGERVPSQPAEPAKPGYRPSVAVVGAGREFGPEALHAMAQACASRQGPVVKVRQIREGEDVEVRPSWDPEHAMKGRPGDWISCYGPGDYGIVEQKIFEETYQRLGAPSAREASKQAAVPDFLQQAGLASLARRTQAQSQSMSLGR